MQLITTPYKVSHFLRKCQDSLGNLCIQCAKFAGQIVLHKIQHVEPIIIPNVPKGIIDKYKKVTLCCDLMYINGIGILNTIYQHIMISKGNIIKHWKIKSIEDGIKQVYKLYLQCCFKITRIHADI